MSEQEAGCQIFRLPLQAEWFLCPEETETLMVISWSRFTSAISALLVLISCHSISFLFPLPPAELGQESVPVSAHNATVVVSAAGVMPYLQSRAAAGDQISTTPAASSSSCDRQPAPPGTMMSSQLQAQSYSLGINNSGLGPPPPKPPGGVYTSTGQHNSSDVCPLAGMVSTANTTCTYSISHRPL